MQRNVLSDPDFELRSELGLLQTYFEAFDSMVAALLDTGREGMLDALHILAEASKSSAACFYLNTPDNQAAHLVSAWRDPDTRLADFTPDPCRSLDYSAYPLLADTLAVGMVLSKSLLELPLAEQMLMAQIGVRQLLCIPLLEKGEPFGFLCFLNDTEVQRSRSELRLLAMLSNHVAQALVKQRVEQELMCNQQRLRALVGVLQDMVFECNQQGVIISVWSGHPDLPSAEMLQGRAIISVLPYELASELVHYLPRILKNKESAQFNCTVQTPNGPVYLLIRLQPVQAPNGQNHAVALVHDVTVLMLEDAQRKTMLDTLNLLEEAVIDLSPTGELVRTTPAWAKLRALDLREVASDLGQPLFAWVHPNDGLAMVEALSKILKTTEPVTQRFRLVQANGEHMWVEARLIAHRTPDGLLSAIRGVLRDVTITHLNEQHITQLALYDSLTKLPNRLMLDSEIHSAIDRARVENTKVALGFIDLDHFKQINDAFGHQIGDELLVNVARQLAGVLRENDVLARWGGDEFVILMPDLTDLNVMRELADRLRTAARQGVTIDGMETQPTISLGFAVFPDNAESGEELLSAADHTMYHAKHTGRNNVCFYSDIVHLKALGREHVAIQSRLSTAIRNNRLQVFYQPIVDARTGEVISVEALARWQDEQSGWISPELFIPMAEKVGLIQELSELVIQQSFSKLREWRDAGLTQKLMINISRSQLFQPQFVTQLNERLMQHRLRAEDVILEITESVALTDYSRQLRHLRQLNASGFEIAIDDFGTGYSSLSQLHEMPAQMIKIDVSFALRLHTEDGRRIMQAIVQLGLGLGLEIVVEGVENLETARFLQGLGVQRMQGFYFSEAVPSGVAELWMRLGLQAKI
ncbi:bifunctional diguanylate cyclase/phosphodiesterase [Janthinobacterium sp. B9-8]|uniref:bifunctional diguanylate cyclase/phosphodiesterase n=1 Tax=Janthinobacterium sp. B9-8 TaxID=1236179 RepID=UPI0006997B92|nr:EAL domain-containing protein [Janthinobacterium sp. B9-8]AMC35625.1 hypothetical protein VN23_13870 [Janthinobacterium sp. B9-8]